MREVTPQWLWDYLGIPPCSEGATVSLGSQEFVVRSGVLRSRKLLSASQAQTGESFGFKWNKSESFGTPAGLELIRKWLIERYGDIALAPWLGEHGENPLVVDAGCGAGVPAIELLGALLPRVRYLGVDVSSAVDAARARFAERQLPGAFLQADITELPFAPRSVDIILSEGVLHHTDSTEQALKSLAGLIKPGGRFLFYVYRRKGPVREFTDDLIRRKLQHMTPEEAWKVIEPLTRLGIELGKLNAEIEIADPIDLLEIPAGRINVQRLFYWHVAKAFYHPELSFDEMNHINYDWYAPINAHRQSIGEVRAWCEDAGLSIEREVVEDAGITIVARRLS